MKMQIKSNTENVNVTTELNKNSNRVERKNNLIKITAGMLY